ncbi:MAG: BatA and WFA domain-containing protein [Anaerolineae bacterium]|nr:BatA and WFA domain-containing protein [Anaerolineae bacterium]
MSLLWPFALAGLLTLPIILILHLLRSRRDRVAIPSLLFWRGLQQEKEGGSPRKIPLSIMLFLQLLAAIILTCGLARPTLSFLLALPEQTVFVLDTTTSMTATDVTGDQTRFDVARQTIQDYIESMGASDQVAVVSLDPRPAVLLSGTGEQKAAALSTLDNLVPGASGANLTAALSLAGGLVNPDLENRIVILTDGNVDSETGPLPAMPAPVEWQFIPDAAPPGNQALFDVSARPLPDGRQRIFARVINYDDAPVARTLRLLVDGQVSQEEDVDIDAQADAVQLWTIPARAESVTIEIVESDALPLDNRADLLLLDTTRRRVLLVSTTPETLSRALEVQPGVDLAVAAPDALAGFDLADFDLIVLDSVPAELTAWPSGNVWVIDPPANQPLLPVETSMLNLRPDMDTASALLDGVDLSGVYFGRVARMAVPEWASIDLMATTVEVETPAPLIFHGTVGSTRVVVWTFNLAASNLPARLALPLLTANTLTTLLAPAPPPAVQIGEPVTLARGFSVEIPDGRRLFPSAEQNISENTFTHTQEPGLYRIYDSSDTLVAGFAVHAGSAPESNLLQRPDRAELEQKLTISPVSPPNPDVNYREFWPWLAGVGLVVIMMEGWLAWRR